MSQRSRFAIFSQALAVAAVVFCTVALVSVLAPTARGASLSQAAPNAAGSQPAPFETTYGAVQGRASSEYLSKGDNGLFELRIYPLKQNVIANTYKFMNNVNEFQKTVGMSIVGHFPDQDAARYIWFRTYPNEVTRDQRYRATYDSAVWKSGKLRGGITETGLAGSTVYLAAATKYSKLQHPYKPTPESATVGAEAKELAKLYAGSPDGQVPNCGKCGSNPFIFEVNLYDVKPGMMDTFVQYMGEKVFAKQEAKGIRVFAQLVPYAKVTNLSNGGTMIPESNTFVAIRLFADEVTRHKQEMSLGNDKEAAAKALEAAGQAGLNHIVYSGHPSFYSQMQQ
jgi:hypothetical protein